MTTPEQMMQDVYDYLHEREYGHDRELLARLRRLERAIGDLPSAVTVTDRDMLVVSFPEHISPFALEGISERFDEAGLQGRVIIVAGAGLAVLEGAADGS